MEIDAVEKIDYNNNLDFLIKNYIKKSRPVILRDFFSRTSPFSLWTPESLAALHGNKKFEVWGTKSDKFIRELHTGEHAINFEMQFDAFIQGLRSPVQQAIRPYLSLTIPEQFPELAEDIVLPDYLKKQNDLSIRLWIGSPGTVTSLHYDLRSNLYYQIFGKKKLILYSPWQQKYLYPFPSNSKIFYVSQVDIEHPDLKQFPAFQKAHSVTAILEKGDTLFLPPGWWHQVYTLEPSINLSFWWRNYLRQCLVPMWRPLLFSRFYAKNKSPWFKRSSL